MKHVKTTLRAAIRSRNELDRIQCTDEIRANISFVPRATHSAGRIMPSRKRWMPKAIDARQEWESRGKFSESLVNHDHIVASHQHSFSRTHVRHFIDGFSEFLNLRLSPSSVYLSVCRECMCAGLLVVGTLLLITTDPHDTDVKSTYILHTLFHSPWLTLCLCVWV